MCGITAVIPTAPSIHDIVLPWQQWIQASRQEDEPLLPNGLGLQLDDDDICSMERLARTLQRRGPDGIQTKRLPHIGTQQSGDCGSDRVEEPVLIASTLCLRGEPTYLPLESPKTGNILAFNGQVYALNGFDSQENDTMHILNHLDTLFASNNAETELLRFMDSIQGPWAVIIYEKAKHRIWFGRDFLGRRSLMIGTLPGRGLVISSVPPTEFEHPIYPTRWQEIPPLGLCYVDLTDVLGNSDATSLKIHSVFRNISILDESLTRNPRGSHTLGNLSFLPRNMRRNVYGTVCESFSIDGVSSVNGRETINGIVRPQEASQTENDALIETILDEFNHVLHQAVTRRLEGCLSAPAERPSGTSDKSVGALFSGGVDSMVMVATIDSVLREQESQEKERGNSVFTLVDLINVSFDESVRFEGPDRNSAIQGYLELEQIAAQKSMPCRFRLVLVDVHTESAKAAVSYVSSLVYNTTPMDRSIGCALWFAAMAKGRDYKTGEEVCSKARVLFSGLGVDEQLAGYKARHRTIYRRGGLNMLSHELDGDLSRIWWRNLGRDDRLISDHGREVRQPFLDEQVISFLCSTPLQLLINLDLPDGEGDKWILRQLGMGRLGLSAEACARCKRAIQFGSNSKKLLERKKEYKLYNKPMESHDGHDNE